MGQQRHLLKCEKALQSEGFSEKMISTAQRIAEASQHRTLRRWVTWFQRLQPDEKLNVELTLLELTFTFKYKKGA